MANSVGEFKILLRRAHKRGTALDAELDSAMARAARWVEMNTTLQYMRQRFELVTEIGSDEIALPKVGIKSILGMRYKDRLDDYGKPIHIRKVSQEEMIYYGEGLPDQFFQDGIARLVFNGTYREVMQITGTLARFTDFPKKDTDTHWLLENAEGLMLAQSMLELGLISRDERSYGMYQSHRSDQIMVLQNADYEAQYAGQDIILAPGQ